MADNDATQPRDGGPDGEPVDSWSAFLHELTVGAMQDEGPDPTARGGFAAYAEWLALVNPPTQERP